MHTDNQGKRWGPGTKIFIGWPHLAQRQARVCLWVQKVEGKWVGYFARAPGEEESESRQCRTDKPLLALQLVEAVLGVRVFVSL